MRCLVHVQTATRLDESHAAESRARVSASSGSSHFGRAIKFLSGTLQSGLRAFGSDLQHTITEAALNGKVVSDMKY